MERSERQRRYDERLRDGADCLFDVFFCRGFLYKVPRFIFLLFAHIFDIIPSLTVVKLKKVLQASIYAACETFLLRNEL